MFPFTKLDQHVRPFDVREILGFTIAGEDQNFVSAQAKFNKNTIEVWSDSVSEPKAVRYAWAGNPECNLINSVGLPVTPFRTDSWKLSTQEESTRLRAGKPLLGEPEADSVPLLCEASHN